ncbi:MAG: hypothetical protein Ct9H90mP8_3690 [Pseudomonadota bacterium]|nr:MAG: hypothetical protein Ct9H90mP8_3690 [Pseudomonadota bacterium]
MAFFRVLRNRSVFYRLTGSVLKNQASQHPIWDRCGLDFSCERKLYPSPHFWWFNAVISSLAASFVFLKGLIGKSVHDVFCCRTFGFSISFSGTQYLDRIDGVIDYTVSENFTETDACTDFSVGISAIYLFVGFESGNLKRPSLKPDLDGPTSVGQGSA